jgi:hypothetical protein
MTASSFDRIALDSTVVVRPARSNLSTDPAPAETING